MGLVVLGDYAWDVLIRTDRDLLRGGDTFGEVTLSPGGSAANVAVWAQRCGLPTTFIGKVGQDRFGGLAREELAREGVEACLVSSAAHPTGSVAVFVDPTGERSMVSGHGADFYLLPTELPENVLQNARHLHLTAWSFFSDPPRETARQAAQLATAAGATVSFDPGSFQMILEMGVANFLDCTQDLGIDLLFPNLEEGQALTGLTDPEAVAHALAELYEGALVALKLDAAGALVLDRGRVVRIPPATNKLVDATGAGDSFAGAFLARYLQNQDAEAAAVFATGVSAWVIELLGSRPEPDAALGDLLKARGV
ncbi:sugar kinase [soil metagenome]